MAAAARPKKQPTAALKTARTLEALSPAALASLLERGVGGSLSKNKMVDKTNAHHLTGLGEPLRESEIFSTRRWIATRMIVETNQARRIRKKSRHEQASRLHRGSINGAPIGNRVPDRSAPNIEQERSHDLLG